MLATNVAYGVGRSSNWGEIDLIAQESATQEIVFIEVKTRSNWRAEEVGLVVDWRKQRRLNRVAQAFLAARGLENDYRFDIIWVLPTQIQHFKNVTW